MKKLKTLKDLTHYNINELKREDFIGIALKKSSKKCVKVETFPIFIFEEHLKEEAIKWVNNYSDMLEELRKLLHIKTELKKEELTINERHKYSFYEGYIKALYDFFNIKEENLK